ncbi:MAG: phosphatidylserine decarboxylase [Verrucomicrobiae bacterium]|nr:phosphatidylserine decarboxylase [Verrucomicrobiae bacterium]
MSAFLTIPKIPRPPKAGVKPKRRRPRLRDRLLLQEDLNFLLTNRIPRILATRAMGRISRIRKPAVTRLGIALWRWFADLDLSDAATQRFDCLQDCFTRPLRPGARPLDPDPQALLSPCDGIVGACGAVEGTTVLQAKGFPYTLPDLFGSQEAAAPYQDGTYVTLRLTSAMYHRFHAPADGHLERISYRNGDTWNVNPIALRRVERLFCRNERAVLHLRLDSGHPIALVPVAAILVAGIRLHCLPGLLRRPGPCEIPCAARVTRGAELGWFEHGSTIIVFAPPGFKPAAGIETGAGVRMGRQLLRFPAD